MKAPDFPRLIDYFRRCLHLEQMDRLQVAIKTGGSAHLRDLSDTLITADQPQIVSDPSHIRELKQYAARRKEGALCYAFPLLRTRSNWVPVCYTTVDLQAGRDRTVLINRDGGELHLNRRFLKHDVQLTDSEIADIAASLRHDKGRSLRDTVMRYINPDEIVFDALLFSLEPDAITRGLENDLDRIGKRSPEHLSAPLRAYLGYAGPQVRVPDASSFLTVVSSNPAQNNVLRARNRTLQVVAGPPGTGKTQTIINLISSAVADGQKVLFISKNNTAVDNVYDAFRKMDLFPGILRMGQKELRVESLRLARAALTEPNKSAELDLNGLTRESGHLAGQLSTLEAEARRTEHLRRQFDEALRLEQQTEEKIRSLPVYGWAKERHSRLDPTNAHLLTAVLMGNLRWLSAIIATWDAPTSGLDRFLELVGLLDWVRQNRLKGLVARLQLPECIQVEPRRLASVVSDLLGLEISYPYLYASARRIIAQEEMARAKSLPAVEAQINEIARQKEAVDQRLLRALWRSVWQKAQQNRGTLQEAFAIEEALAAEPKGDSERRKRRNETFRQLISSTPIVCCTNLSLASSVPNDKDLFDLVVLDEASQSDIASLLPALYRARRACIVGDDQQLRHISSIPPAEDLDLMTEAGLKGHGELAYSTHSAFDRACAAAGEANVQLLDRHYRCTSEIIQFCNREFYAGRLRIERKTPAEAKDGLPRYGFLMDDVPTGATLSRTPSGSSPANEAEARRVVYLALRYIEQGLRDIGVVTPFRAQRLLIESLLNEAAASAASEATREGLKGVEVGTIHTFQGSQKEIMLFSTVVAPGARDRTVGWFQQNQNLINVAISRARNLLILVCHRTTLVEAGGILLRMVEWADDPTGAKRGTEKLPPGLQPGRFGLRDDERDVLSEWLAPGTVMAVLNPGEKELFQRLQQLTAGHPILLSPKIRVLDAIDAERTEGLSAVERDYAFRAHFDVTLIDTRSMLPVAAVELDGRQHSTDGLSQARDRLKDNICHKVGLPLVRVRWGDWGGLEAIRALLARR